MYPFRANLPAVAEPTFSEVDSSPVTEMQDGSATGLLKELNRVQSRVPMVLFAIIGSIALMVVVTVIAIRMEEVDRSRFRQAIVPANSADAVSSAEVLRDRYAAMARRAEQLLARHEATLTLRWYFLLGATVTVGLAALSYARHRDVTYGTAVLTYDLETSVQQWFSRLLAAFTEFASGDRVWHIQEKGAMRIGSETQARPRSSVEE